MVALGKKTQRTLIYTMAEKKVITVDYKKSFEEILVEAGVPKHQREKIFEQLRSKKLEFPHKGEVSFAIQNFRFDNPTKSRAAEKYIRGHDTEPKWKPFDIEHLLAYFRKYPSKFKSRLVFASRRTFKIQGTSHIFCMSIDKIGHADLELVPDDHAWAPFMSIFPGQRKV
jgi:hypothetical protein